MSLFPETPSPTSTETQTQDTLAMVGSTASTLETFSPTGPVTVYQMTKESSATTRTPMMALTTLTTSRAIHLTQSTATLTPTQTIQTRLMMAPSDQHTTTPTIATALTTSTSSLTTTTTTQSATQTQPIRTWVCALMMHWV